MRLFNLTPAIGDGRKTLVAKQRERNGSQKIPRMRPGRAQRHAFKREPGSPQPAASEQQQAADLHKRHHKRKALDEFVAQDVDKKSKDEQSDAQNRNEQTVFTDVKELQRIRPESASDEAFIDDHRKVHQQRTRACDRSLAVSLLQNHGDTAR